MPMVGVEIVFGKPRPHAPSDVDGVIVSFPIVVQRPATGNEDPQKVNQSTVVAGISGTLATMWGFTPLEQIEEPGNRLVPLLFETVRRRLPRIVEQILENDEVRIELGAHANSKGNPYDMSQLRKAREIEGHVEKIVIELDDEPTKGPLNSPDGNA